MNMLTHPNIPTYRRERETRGRLKRGNTAEEGFSPQSYLFKNCCVRLNSFQVSSKYVKFISVVSAK